MAVTVNLDLRTSAKTVQESEQYWFLQTWDSGLERERERERERKREREKEREASTSLQRTDKAEKVTQTANFPCSTVTTKIAD